MRRRDGLPAALSACVLLGACAAPPPLPVAPTESPAPTVSAPPPVEAPRPVRRPRIVAGDDHACLIDAKGALFCWGDNQHGALGDGTDELRAKPVRINVPEVVDVALGTETCAVVEGGRVFCWGGYRSKPRLLPEQVVGVEGARAIALGRKHACVLLASGEVAHVDGGGQGVLPVLWNVANAIARHRNWERVEWIVHAIRCANPNPVLQRVLQRKGFTLRELPTIGQVYFLAVEVPSAAQDPRHRVAVAEIRGLRPLHHDGQGPPLRPALPCCYAGPLRSPRRPARIPARDRGLRPASGLARPLLMPLPERNEDEDVLSDPEGARFGRQTVMKINGKMMMAVVMVVGSLAATGCSTNAADTGAVAPEETAATAPVENTAANGVEKDARIFHYYAPFAPPAARFEVRGLAPSARHFWAPGYYRWNGREHVWVAGRWELRRDGFELIGPHWVRRVGRFEYLPGRWIRRF